MVYFVVAYFIVLFIKNIKNKGKKVGTIFLT